MLSKWSALVVVVLLLVSSAASSVADVPRVVVAEHFGFIGSPFCEWSRCGLQMVEDEFDDQFIWWDIHWGDQYQIPEGLDRATWYGVTGVPDVRIDGKSYVLGAESCVGAYMAYRDYVVAHLAEHGGLSAIEITGHYLIDSGDLTADLDIRLDDHAPPGDLRATVLVYETGVDGQWPNVLRALYDEDLYIMFPDEIQPIDAIFSVDPAWDEDSLNVVAYVQRIPGDKEIYQGYEVPRFQDFTCDFDRVHCALPAGYGTAVFDAVITNPTDTLATLIVGPGMPYGDWTSDFLVCGDYIPHTSSILLELDPYESCEIQVRVFTDGVKDVREGSFIVESFDSGRTKETNLRVYNLSHSILLVDDDIAHDDEVPILNALDSLGYLYDHWDAFYEHGGATPVYEDMAGYSVVIWHHSWWPQPPYALSELDVASLMEYMDEGGNLFLTSQVFLDAPTGPPAFITSYLGVESYIVDPEPGYEHVDGVPGDPIGDGLLLPLDFPLSSLATGDHLEPGPDASVCMTTPPDFNVCVRNMMDNRAKSVFMAFALNAVSETDPDPDNIETVLDRILTWMTPSSPIHGSQCSVEPWDSFGQAFVSPGGVGSYTDLSIQVRNAAGHHYNNAHVEIIIPESCTGLCIDDPQDQMSGYTNAAGWVDLLPKIGGCADCPIEVRANGITIRTYYRIVSTDWNGFRADGHVTNGDLAFFGAEYAGGVGYHPCADYDGDGRTNPFDFGIFVSAYGPVAHNYWPCAGSPQTRACCFDVICELLSEEDCLDWGGTWTGLETCRPNPCGPPGLGACCLVLEGSRCEMLTLAECLAQPGVWDGGETCHPNPCPTEEALGAPCPPGGLDVFDDTDAAFLLDVPGYGPRAVIASGPTAVLRRIRQFEPGGPCVINTEIVGMTLTGTFNPDCRDPLGERAVTVTLGESMRSVGTIVSSHDGDGNPAFPDTSLFTVNVIVDIEGIGPMPHTVEDLGNVLHDDNLWDYEVCQCLRSNDGYQPPSDDHAHYPCDDGGGKGRTTGCCVLGSNEFYTTLRLCESIGGVYQGDGETCPSGCVQIPNMVPELGAKEVLIGEITPNPAMGPVRMSYALGAESVVRVDLMDASGRLIRTYPIGHKGAGQYEFVWDRKDSKGRKMPAGVYFLTLDTGRSRTTRGVVLLK